MKIFSNSIALWLGTLTPAVLSIFFITKFWINTVFWDEWEIVPLLSILFGGDILSLELTGIHNEHLPFFHRLIVLGLASISSYNIFLEVIVGWIFLTLTILVLWFLLVKTFPEAKLLIIPISWVSYTFVQYENFLSGWNSIHWHSTMFFVITAIYLLEDIKKPIKSVGIFLALCFVASFTNIIGFVTWIIGFYNFRYFKPKYFIVISACLVLTVYFYFLVLDEQGSFEKIRTNLNDQLDLVKFVFTFLGNLIRATSVSSELIPLSAGIIIFSIFLIMIIYSYFKINDQQLRTKLRPWINISAFSFLSGVLIGLGRLDFGVQEALANRYIVVSNLFFDAAIVITAVILLQLLKNEKQENRKKILKGFFVVLIIFLCFYILIGYVGGWIGASIWHEKISTGGECLLVYETASDECLEVLYPNADAVKNRAKVLQDLCIGPFVVNCSP